MKKQLLFVMPSLALGGAEKSLISLLNCIDYDLYSVDLLLFSDQGVLQDTLHPNVNVTVLDGDYKYYGIPVIKAVFTLFLKGKWRLLCDRIQFFMMIRFIKNPFILEQKLWKVVTNSITPIQKKYDAAIGYLEKTSHYLILDKVTATKKIGWIHSDLEAMGLDINHEYKYLKRLDAIITVSDGLQARLGLRFEDLAAKMHTIENIIAANYIKKQAQEPLSKPFDSNCFNIVFVGRLAKEKGLFNALEALKILIDKDFDVCWYLIGTGDQKTPLIERIEKYKMSKNVFFLDFQENPYKFLYHADMFLLTSDYEGKSIALEEAKILNKKIVITDFSSAKDQIIDGKTGLIAIKNPKDIAVKIEQFITDKEFANKVHENLKQNANGNAEEVLKLYKIIKNG